MLEQFEQDLVQNINFRMVYWKLEGFIYAINNILGYEKLIDILTSNSHC